MAGECWCGSTVSGGKCDHRAEHDWKVNERLCDAWLFKPNGKYKYSVKLDFEGIIGQGCLDPQGKYVDPSIATLKALRQATERGYSGVSLVAPGDYALVCIEPPWGFPILIQGEHTLWKVD